MQKTPKSRCRKSFYFEALPFFFCCHGPRIWVLSDPQLLKYISFALTFPILCCWGLVVLIDKNVDLMKCKSYIFDLQNSLEMSMNTNESWFFDKVWEKDVHMNTFGLEINFWTSHRKRLGVSRWSEEGVCL